MSQKIILILLILFATLFSFYHLEKLYGFEFDQERDYYIVKSVVVDHKLTLIGPRVVSSAGFYLGPWYYYLQVPFFIALAGNPIYGAVFTGFINVLICLLIYFVLNRHTKMRLFPFMAAALWVSAANRSNWNVQFVPLFLLLFLHFYWRKRHFLLTLTFAYALNFHPQMIFLAPLWFHALRQNFKKTALLHALAFIIPFLPLVAFDLRHQFVNTLAVFHFLAGSSLSRGGVAPFRFLYSLRQFSTAIDYIFPPLQHNLILISALLLATFIFCLKFKKYFPFFLLTLLSLVILSFYREPTWPEYYHSLGGFSFFLLLIFIVKEFNLLKYPFSVLALYIIWTNFYFITTYVSPGGYFFKKEMLLYMLAQNKPYDRLNIINDFPYGEGLGFLPIREFYEKPTGQYPPQLKFYISYANNPKHNLTKKEFGLYAISKINDAIVPKF